MKSQRLRVLLNIAWLMGDGFARSAAGLAVGVVVARHLGPADYGKISYVEAIVAVLAIVAGMGLEPILMKELVAGKHPPHTTYSTALGIAAFSSIIATVIGLLYAYLFVDDQSLRPLFFIAFSSLPIQTAAIISVPLQAQEKFSLLVRYQLIQIGISVALRVLLVWLDVSLAWFMFAFTADATVWLLLLLKLRYGHETRFHPRHITFDLPPRFTPAPAPRFPLNFPLLLPIRIHPLLLPT